MDAQTTRELESLKKGFYRGVGEFSMAVAPATSTTVTCRLCSSGSVVIPVPYNAAAATAGIPRIVPGNGSFVVHHASDAGTRTYRYAVFTGT